MLVGNLSLYGVRKLFFFFFLLFPTMVFAAGRLSVEIVGRGEPGVAFSSISFSWDTQTSTGTLGNNKQRIRITNTTGNPIWTLSIAPATGPSALWQSVDQSYDFNDPSGAGQLTVLAETATIVPVLSCTSVAGITRQSQQAFVEGIVDAVSLLVAGPTAAGNCRWEVIGITLRQTVPGGQRPGTYTLSMMLTIV